LEEGEGGRRSGKARIVDQTAGMCGHDGMGFHALKYLSVGSLRARRSGCAGGSQKCRKDGSPFWDPSIEGGRAREPRGAHFSLVRRLPRLSWLTLLSRCERLKRQSVTLERILTSVVMPSPKNSQHSGGQLLSRYATP
jgi:hypothetical protein